MVRLPCCCCCHHLCVCVFLVRLPCCCCCCCHHPCVCSPLCVHRRPAERLLRKVLSLPNNPAVVLVHAYAWHRPDPFLGNFYNNAERDYNELAEYYGLTAVSVKSCCYEAMRNAEPGFQVGPASSRQPAAAAGGSQAQAQAQAPAPSDASRLLLFICCWHIANALAGCSWDVRWCGLRHTL